MELNGVLFLLSLNLSQYSIISIFAGAAEISTSEVGVNSASDSEHCEDQGIERLFSNGIKSYVYYNTKHDKKIQKQAVLSLNDFKQEGSNLKILMHGFMSSCDAFEDDIIPAYLEEFEKIKIVCIDWSTVANPEGGLAAYDETLQFIPDIGAAVADLIGAIVKTQVIQDLSHLHIIGFSLGAHLAGIVGNEVHTNFGEKVGRITGLDPAGPGFDTLKSTDNRLDKSDANFVDIIHTCHGLLGTSIQSGHVDFYVNGGRQQPWCFTESDPIKKLAEALSGLCSHQSARLYYAMSIKTQDMKACECNSYGDYKRGDCDCSDDMKVVLGEYCNTTVTFSEKNCSNERMVFVPIRYKFY